MKEVKLLYVDCLSTVTKTKTGFEEYSNTEYYERNKARGYTIVKIDLLSALTKLFDEDSRNKYRQSLYAILYGKLDEKIMLNFLRGFYEEDSIFRDAFDEFYYFYLDDVDGATYFDKFISYVGDKIQDIETELNMLVNGTTVAYNNGYVFKAVKDDIDEITIPKDIKVEVLLNDKIRVIQNQGYNG